MLKKGLNIPPVRLSQSSEIKSVHRNWAVYENLARSNGTIDFNTSHSDLVAFARGLGVRNEGS